jgi:pectinesterase
MKNRTALFRGGWWLLLASVAMVATLPSEANAQTVKPSSQQTTLLVRVENPVALERRDETIAIPWSAVQQRLPAATATRIRVRDLASGAELVTQALDSDANGSVDSLLFQSSFLGAEARTFSVEAEPPTAAAKSRVHVKFIPERTDVAWESDRIAFRTYGQLLWQLENLHSSGVDVWVKRTRDLVLDKWYAAGHDAYHLDKGEGADFYKVGPTLGAGATAIWRGGKLHRAENFKTHRIIADGPIRAIFELDFDPWDAGGLQVTERKRVAIDAGQNMYWQRSTFTAQGADSIVYAVGFVKRPGLVGSTSRAQSWAWLTGWGPVDNKPGEGGHGDLGTAVMLDRSRVLDMKETDDHFVLTAVARSGQAVVHYIGAGWTGSRDFRDVNDWWAYLGNYARRVGAPLKVTVGVKSLAD